MSLADQLGVSDPTTMMPDLISQRAPDLAQGTDDPSVMMDRLIHKTMDASQQRRQAPAAPAFNSSSYGRKEGDAPSDVPFASSGYGVKAADVPPAQSGMPGVVEAAKQGLSRAGQEIGLSAELGANGMQDPTQYNPSTGTVPIVGGDISAPPTPEAASTPPATIHTNPQPLPPETSPAAAPMQWSDLAHPIDQLAPKLAYGTGKGLPELGAAVAGGAVAGPLGAGMAAGAMQMAQSIGPIYEDALKETNGNTDEAYALAKERAVTEGAISGASFAAFGIEPFDGAVKNLLLQGTAIQPAIAAGGKAAENLEEGRPLGEGVAQTIPGAVAGTIIPGLAMHAVGALRGRGGEAGQQPGEADAGAQAAGPQPVSPSGPNPESISPEFEENAGHSPGNSGFQPDMDEMARAMGAEPPGAAGGPPPDAQWDARMAAGDFHIDPNASDEEVIRQTGFPEDVVKGMSAADKKTLANHIRDRFKAAQEEAAAGPGSAGAQPGPEPEPPPQQPPGGGDTYEDRVNAYRERMRAREQARQQQAQDEAEAQNEAGTSGRIKLEKIAAYYGEHDTDEIKSWSMERLKDYVAQKTTKTASDDEVLRRAGVSPDEAAAMSDEEKKATAEEARGYGVHASAEPEQATSFTTAKGSTYQVHDDGTTTRDKAYRPEHGAAEQGPQPRSDRTVYVDPADAQRLAMPQGGTARVVEHPNGTLSVATLNADGRWGIAPSALNVPFSTEPHVGVNPIELWGSESVNGLPGYRRIHLGNEITKVGAAARGTRANPIEPETAEDVARAAAQARQDYTDAQGEAGNVARGHMVWPPNQPDQFGITIEVPAAGTRRGLNPETGKPWATQHPHVYGYLKSVPAGGDKGAPDITVGDHPTAPTVFILDEMDKKTGAWRQTKSFAGFQTWQDALGSYLATSSKDVDQVGGMTAMPAQEFVQFAKNGGLSKPVSDSLKGGESGTPNGPDAAGNKGIRAGTRNEPNAGVRGVEADEASLQQPELQRVQGLRRSGDQGLSGVAGQLPGVLPGHGAETDAGAQRGAQAQPRGLRPRQLRVGDQGEAGAQHAQEPPNSLSGGNAADRGSVPPRGGEQEARGRQDTVGLAREPTARSGGGGTEQEEQAHNVSGAHAQPSGVGKGTGSAHPHGIQAHEEGVAPRESIAAVEAAVRSAGLDPAKVSADDIDRAARIHEQEGAPPADAFIVAVARNLVDAGLLKVTDEEAKLLGPDGETERGARAAESGAGPGGQVAPDEAGERARGAAAGAAEGAKPGRSVEAAANGETAHGAGRANDRGNAGDAEVAGSADAAVADQRAEPGAANSKEPARGKSESGVRADEHQDAGPAAKAAVEPKAQSLLQFLASRGGIRSDDKLIADVKSILGRNNHFVPGHGALIRQPKTLSTAARKGGAQAPMSLDQAREAAVESGYLSDIGALTDKPAESTIKTLLDAIEEEARGNKQYPIGHEPTAAMTSSEAGRQEERTEDLAKARAKLESALKKAKYPIGQAHPEDLTRATELMVDEGLDPVDAFERATIMGGQDQDEVVATDDSDYIDFEDSGHAPEPNSAHAQSKALASEGAARVESEPAEDAEAGGGARDVRESASGRSEPVAAAAGQRPGPEPASGPAVTERTSAGEQRVLPGAERIAGAELAKRRAGERLKPKVAQRAADEGLFGDESKQTDLVDMARAKSPENQREPNVHLQPLPAAALRQHAGGLGATPEPPQAHTEGNTVPVRVDQGRKAVDREAQGQSGTPGGGENPSGYKQAAAPFDPTDARTIEPFAERNGPAFDERQPNPNVTGGFTDLGKFPRGKGDLGRQAQTYVVDRGRASGVEHLVASDAQGNVIAHGYGNDTGTGMPENLSKAIQDPAQSIVIHHNHPDNGSLSTPDLAHAALAGIHSIWSHGHEGAIERVAPTPQARAVFGKMDPAQAVAKLYGAAEQIRSVMHDQLQKAVWAHQITSKEALEAQMHLVGLALDRAGVIDYQSNLDLTRLIERAYLDPYIERAARWAAGRLLNDAGRLPYRPAAGDLQRSARPIGPEHPGEVGATFEGAGSAAGQPPAQAIHDRNRQEGAGAALGLGLRETPPEGQKGFHHNQPPEGEHIPPGDYRAGGGGAGKPPGGGGRPPGPAPDDPMHPGSWSIRRKISDALASDTALVIKEKLQDYNARVERLQNQIEARSHHWVSDDPDNPLPDDQQFYTLKRLFPGKRANRMLTFEKEQFKPLRDFMRKSGISLEEAGDYLYARHAPERNMNVGPLHPPEHQFFKAMRDADLVGASGMASNAARAKVKAYESGPKGAAFNILRDQVAGIRRFIQEEMVRGSLESAETMGEWNRTAADYVPLKGWENPAEAKPFVDQQGRRPPGSDIKGRETQQALGRRTKADNPLVALVDQAYRTVDRAEKNLAYHGLGRMLKAVGPEALKEIGIALNRGRPKRVVDRNTGLVTYQDDSFDAMRPNAVHFKVNGKDQYVIFDDQRLADGVKRWSPYTNKFISFISKYTSKWKSLATHYNPMFMPRHMARYWVEGMINSLEMKEHGPYSFAKYAKDSFPVLGPATRAILAREKGVEGGKLGQYWDEMKAGGGASSMFAQRDYDELLDRLKHKASALGEKASNVREIMSSLSDVVDKYTSVIDNSTRLAAYAQARDAGKSIQQANMVAREATIDYNLRGEWSHSIGMVMPFQNVAGQTGFRMGAALYRSNTMRWAFGFTAALGFALASWNYSFGGDDKDGKPFYDKIAPWDRSMKAMLFAGGADDKGRPQPIAWPMPYNYAFPMTLGSAAASAIWGKEAPSTVSAMAIKSLLSTFSQIGDEGLAWRDLAPELVRPMMDVALNTKWSGGSIHEDPTFQKKPDAYSAFRETDKVWSGIAQFLNYVSGGNAARNGWMHLYPEDIEYYIKSYFGGQERPIEEIAKAYNKAEEGKTLLPSDIPIASIFYGEDYDKANAAASHVTKHMAAHPYERPTSSFFQPRK